MSATYFATPSEFRTWLARNHAETDEVLVGFHKRGSQKPSMTWSEAVDEALCFGWIDGVRRTVDAERYTIRFTPRKPRSTWSAVNVKKAQELIRSGRMRAAGRKAFEAREEKRSGVYAYEQREAARLSTADERLFRKDSSAWAFFQAQPPWYRKAATWWVVSPKKDETRRKRLVRLIEDSGKGRTVPPLTRPSAR